MCFRQIVFAFFHIKAPPLRLPDSIAADFIADLIGNHDHGKVNNGIEQTDCGTVAVVAVYQTFPVNEGGNNVGFFQVIVVVEQNDLLIADVQNAAHPQDQQQDDRTGDTGQGHVKGLFESPCAVGLGHLVKLLIDACQSR